MEKPEQTNSQADIDSVGANLNDTDVDSDIFEDDLDSVDDANYAEDDLSEDSLENDVLDDNHKAFADINRNYRTAKKHIKELESKVGALEQLEKVYGKPVDELISNAQIKAARREPENKNLSKEEIIAKHEQEKELQELRAFKNERDLVEVLNPVVGNLVKNYN